MIVLTISDKREPQAAGERCTDIDQEFAQKQVAQFRWPMGLGNVCVILQDAGREAL